MAWSTTRWECGKKRSLEVSRFIAECTTKFANIAGTVLIQCLDLLEPPDEPSVADEENLPTDPDRV
jgi:hypothetical protein